MNQALRKWGEVNASIISYHVAEGERGGGEEYTENKCTRIEGVRFGNTVIITHLDKGGEHK